MRRLSQEFYDKLIRDSLTEMRADYIYSMKRAIMDYVTISAVERERLKLEALERVLFSLTDAQRNRMDVVLRTLSDEWRDLVDEAREEIAWTLQTLSANALELTSLWIQGGFSGRLLVEVSSNSFMVQLPLEVEDFKTIQTEQCERAKGMLWTTWVPKSAEVFRRLPPVCINGDAEAYYRSISTLQANQIRQLCRDSLAAYVAFFKEHPPVEEVDPQGDQLMWKAAPVLNLDLEINGDGKQALHPSFDEVQDAVQGIMDSFVQATHGIPRLGSNVASGFGTSNRAKATTIPSVSLDDEDVVLARKQVLDIMEGNSVAPRKLATLFDGFMYLVAMDKAKTVKGFCAKEPPPDLEAFKAEIDKYYEAARDIRLMCTNVVRTGIYSVRCEKFKEQLASEAEEIARLFLEEVSAPALGWLLPACLCRCSRVP